MKLSNFDIFNYHTEVFSQISAAVLSIFSIWLAILKIKNIRKNRKEKIEKVYKKSEQVYNLLLELQEQIKSRDVILSIAMTTNGGGVPKADEPRYIQALYATHDSILRIWGVRSLITSTVTKAISETISSEKSEIEIGEFGSNKIESWADNKKIEKVFYFLIGFKRKATYQLIINSSSKEDLTNEDLENIYTHIEKIQKCLNNNKKWYEQKIR